jgi:membrane associated rhomboid family serine protease
MMNITPTVKQLLIINILFFVCSLLVPTANQVLSLHYLDNSAFGAWQFVTYMFMHANPLHIFFNMFALFSFGSTLEQFWGGKKFLFFYISCDLGAAALHMLINYFQVKHGYDVLVSNGFSMTEIKTLFEGGSIELNGRPAIDQSALSDAADAYRGVMLGASGAVYGLLVAFAFMFPDVSLGLLFIPIPIKAKYFVPGILCLDLFLGLKGSSLFGQGGTGIAHFAHIGGALIGFLMMWFWKRNSFNKNRWN